MTKKQKKSSRKRMDTRLRIKSPRKPTDYVKEKEIFKR